MRTPTEVFQMWKKNIKSEWKLAFMAAVVIGLMVHLPMMLSDIPNHDGLDSMYFDQNMITSGRWFLMVACGFSSYYTLPWLIGVIALLWLGVTAALLVEFLEVKDLVTIVLISGLLVTFPALASTFAYVFTMDGYMLALMLAVAAVVCVKKLKYGFLPGAVCLAFSLGTYQSYLAFTVILCIYGILMLALENGTVKDKFKKALQYLYMGILGVVLYYGILQVLLKLQGKVLDTYQGINSMESGILSGGVSSLLSTILNMYRDFFAFTINGNVLVNNTWSMAAFTLLALLTMFVLLWMTLQKGWWKKLWFWCLLLLAAVGLPVATNIILLITPNVTYHLLMRYQWVLYLILPISFISRYGRKEDVTASWGVLLAGVVLAGNFAVTDNIAYSNLEKRYEKTYAYCVRLLDRIEQTPGYYQGIPIAMIGVVGDESYPLTDITGKVTSNMIGMNGDVLLYTGDNYQRFIKHYLGADLNILPAEVMEEIYYSEEYRAMDSFPGENSTQVVDGILYVKTENVDKTSLEDIAAEKAVEKAAEKAAETDAVGNTN